MDFNLPGSVNNQPDPGKPRLDGTNKSNTPKPLSQTAQTPKPNPLEKLFQAKGPKAFAQEIVKQLSNAKNNPRVQEILQKTTITPNNGQMISIALFGTLLHLFEKKLSLTSTEEEEILAELEERYKQEDEENDENDPKNKKQKKKRKKSNNPKVEAIITILEKAMEKLEKTKYQDFGIEFTG